MHDTIDILCQLEERAVKDIKKLLMKDDITPAEWDTAGKAVDIIKDVATTKAMKEEYPEEMGESSRYYYRGGSNSYGKYPDYDGYSGRGMNSRRGSSYASEMSNAANNIRNLMNQTTNENERNMYARWLDEAERMNR